MKPIKLTALSLVVALTAGCQSTDEPTEFPKEAKIVNQKTTFGSIDKMVEYRKVIAISKNNDLGMCLSSSISNTKVSFSGTEYSQGAYTGNIYKNKGTKTEQSGNTLKKSASNFATGQEQKTIPLPDAFGLFDLDHNLKHDIAIKFDNDSLIIKFFNLNAKQANSGSAGAGSFDDDGIPTHISGHFNAVINYYESTAAKIADCIDGEF